MASAPPSVPQCLPRSHVLTTSMVHLQEDATEHVAGVLARVKKEYLVSCLPSALTCV